MRDTVTVSEQFQLRRRADPPIEAHGSVPIRAPRTKTAHTFSDPNVRSVPQAAARLGISKDLAYDLARRGQLPGAIHLGRRWRVSLVKLNQFVHGTEDRLAEETGLIPISGFESVAVHLQRDARMPEPSAHGADVSAGGDRCGGAPVAKLVKAPTEAEPSGQSDVPAGEPVGEAWRGTVGAAAQNVRVTREGYADGPGVGLLLRASMLQQRSQSAVDGDVPASMGLGRPFGRLAFDNGGDHSMRKTSRFQSTSDRRKAHSSPRRAPVTAVRAMAVGRTGSVSSAARTSFWTEVVSGATAEDRLSPGGEALSAGLKAIESHLTA
jgi:excisionase family DNA binding protein